MKVVKINSSSGVNDHPTSIHVGNSTSETVGETTEYTNSSMMALDDHCTQGWEQDQHTDHEFYKLYKW